MNLNQLVRDVMHNDEESDFVKNLNEDLRDAREISSAEPSETGIIREDITPGFYRLRFGPSSLKPKP
jgi:hypothetical protein